MARKRRRVVGAALVALTLAAAVSMGLWWKPWASLSSADSKPDLSDAVTAEVTRGTLTSALRLAGVLTYGEAQPLSESQGMITSLPTAGQVISQGQQVYEVEGKPVILMKGERPFWRELSAGVEAGEDVRQLQNNLRDLGFLDREADGKFGWWTEDAVKRWQKSLGMEKTGVFDPASVVVIAPDQLRINRVTAEKGQSDVSPATYTVPTRQVQSTLTEAQLAELSVGRPVQVQLASGDVMDGTISELRNGQPAAEGVEAVKPTAIISLSDPASISESTSSTVRVILPDEEEATETLLVPVTALIATANDTYAVEVIRGGQVVRVPVELGLVQDSQAQVITSGADGVAELAEGDLVVISK